MKNNLNYQKKKELRYTFKKRRHAISLKNRLFAEKAILNKLKPIIEQYSSVLSYASFTTELSTKTLNTYLSQKGKLLLPRTYANNEIRIFKVDDLNLQLSTNSNSFPEPDPNLCEEIDPKSISFALIPGLSFDTLNHRLGYGKGYYDRFLLQIPNCLTLGIGFLQQFSTLPLPTENTDIPLKHCLLV